MNTYQIIREHRKLMSQRKYWVGEKRKKGYAHLAELVAKLRRRGYQPD